MNDLLRTRTTVGSVECFGTLFADDVARRAHFLKLLAEQLKNPSFRNQEGFPKATDKAILALSNPPYYTACPNPWLADFLKYYGKPYDPSERYAREPFTADVNEGKNDPIYNAHSYHTKVPPRAIVRYLLNYTEPGDIVFDGFCGTGMTAVAAQLCGDRSVIQELGYRVDADGSILSPEIEAGKTIWHKVSMLGPRRAIINDLSPAATFIAYNYNRPQSDLDDRLKPILELAESKYKWMYQTLHRPDDSQLDKAVNIIRAEPTSDISLAGPTGRINYIVWSDVFLCPECAGDIIYWSAAVDKENGKIFEDFKCPHCDADLGKDDLDSKIIRSRDIFNAEELSQRAQVPAYIVYSVGSKRFEKLADRADLELATKIGTRDTEYWFPTHALKKGDKTG